MRTFGPGILIFLTIAAASTPAFAQNGQQKKPLTERAAPPNRTEYQKALNEIKTLCRAEYESLGPDTSYQFSMTLADMGRKSKNPVERYALYREAIRIAARGGHPIQAWKTTNRLIQAFHVDSFAIRNQVFDTLSETVATVQGSIRLLAIADAWIQELIRRDQYDAAAEVATRANKLARRAQLMSWQSHFRDRQKTIRKWAKRYQEYRSAFERLAKTPDDATSHGKVGSFYCFEKGDFPQGLPHLARGNQSALADLARRELARGDSPADRVKLANDWLRLAERMDNEYAREWTVFHLRQAIGKLDGLEKRRAQARLEKIRLADPARIAFEQTWTVKWSGKNPNWKTWSDVRFFRDGTMILIVNNVVTPKPIALSDDAIHFDSKDGKFHFTATPTGPMRLAFARIEARTNRVVDRGIGSPVRLETPSLKR